jgi:uncharacterized membrane protein
MKYTSKPRPKKRRQPLDPATILIIRQSLFGLAIFSVVALLITGVWYGTRLPFMTISIITAEGGETIDPDLVLAKANEALSGTYLGLVPKRFSWWFPEVAVYEAVSQVPRIKDVMVTKLSGHELALTYGEYKPAALWCSEHGSTTPCLFLDGSGYAFGVAPNLTGESVIRYQSLGKEPTIKEQPFLETDFALTRKFIAALASSGWFVTRVEIDSARDVFYTLSPSGEVKANLNQSPELVLAQLSTLRQSAEFSHLLPGKFQYIDVRFSPKLFVNEEALTTVDLVASTTTASSTEDHSATLPNMPLE